MQRGHATWRRQPLPSIHNPAACCWHNWLGSGGRSLQVAGVSEMARRMSRGLVVQSTTSIAHHAAVQQAAAKAAL